MIAFAGSRLGYPAFARGISWANCVLGAWTFASPWIWGYTGPGYSADPGRVANSLIIGAIVFVLGIVSAVSTPQTGMPLDSPQV